ncbi:MAG: peptidase C14, partial [Cyanobacteria bacterium J06623_1]
YSFCDRIGWKKDGQWRKEIIYQLETAPQGHLPEDISQVFEYLFEFGEDIISLLFRTKDCTP